jgi:glycosyltransferase involved in cell wall biosynthesis
MHRMNSCRVPTVSVVITCYNYGQYLTGCLESVLAQSYTDYEVIVIDDGSTDNTVEVMEGYAALSNVSYARRKNGGQAKAKNHGIKLSRGKFIAFLDADDKWDSRKLEKQIPLFSSDKVGVVYTRARYIDNSGSPLFLKQPNKYLKPRRGKVTDYLIIDNFVPFSSSIIRRDCINDFGPFDESIIMGIDWDLWLRISTKYEFDYINERLLYYRMGHSGQMSKNIEERQRCSDRIMNRFIQNFPNSVKKNSLRKAFSYTFTNKGNYHSKKQIAKALKFYILAYLYWPLTLVPAKKILRILINKKLL